MSRNRYKLLTAITLILCAGLFCVKLTGGSIHTFLGLLFAVLMAVHVFGNRHRMGCTAGSMKTVSVLLLAALVLMVVSGILMHPFSGNFIIKIIHKLSGVLVVAGIIIHIVQHKNT